MSNHIKSGNIHCVWQWDFSSIDTCENDCIIIFTQVQTSSANHVLLSVKDLAMQGVLNFTTKRTEYAIMRGIWSTLAPVFPEWRTL